ncbi:MAG: carboxypeptidase M32 [Vulcanimicrobiota bacterium]
MSVLEAFRKQSETICHLKNARRLLNWDQQIVMTRSPQAVEVRGRQQATLALLAHQKMVSPAFGELLERAADALAGDLDSVDAQSVAHWKRERRRATSVKAELVEELSLAAAEAFDAWRRAKAADDFSVFEPHLTRMFRLKREEARQIGFEGHPYDAMVDEFEPGMTQARLVELFAELRPHLVRGVQLIMDSPWFERVANGPLDQDFPVEAQERFAKFLSEAIGFPAINRLDEGAHPFCSASSSHDVRLVTRYHPDEVGTSIFATLHETGHGLYELHSPNELEFTPLRGGASLGVHESQSRLWENLVGRSEQFWRWVFPRMRGYFPQQLGGYEWRDLHRAVNRVRPSLIRVEADEVTYSLHVILRWELEAALLAGEIEAKDVPALWNQKVEESFGIKVPSDAAGCLQDIHWSDGLVGYFPTYALGNLIASDLWLLIRRDLCEVDEQIARGEFQPLLGWLTENVYTHAARYLPGDLLEKVLGHEVRTGPFVDYLQNKYSILYEVNWS